MKKKPTHLDQAMFRTKRKEHHNIIQTLGQMKTDVKRYKAVQLLMDQIFKVINGRKVFRKKSILYNRF